MSTPMNNLSDLHKQVAKMQGFENFMRGKDSFPEVKANYLKTLGPNIIKVFNLNGYTS